MSSSAPAASVDAVVAGYRLLRRLGAGTRAAVYLGIDAEAPVPVAVKVFHAEVAVASIDRELGALTVHAGENMVELRDLHRGAGTPTAFVFDRVRPLLGETEATLGPGQATTVLVPLLRTIAGVHRGGLAHGALRPAALGVDGQGRPLVLGWGHSVARDDPAFVETCRADRRALAALCHVVIRRVAEGRERAVLGDLAQSLEHLEETDVLDGLADQLLAELPARVLQPTVLPLPSAPPGPAPFLRTASVAPEATSAPPVAPDATAGPLSAAAAAARRHASILLAGTPRRTRLLGVAGTVALAAATIMLWPGSPSAVPSAEPSAGESLSAPSTAPLSADPADAAGQLLAARARCLAEASVLCLDAVDDSSAALFLEDQRRIAGEETATDVSIFDEPWKSARLSERDGDAALVALERGNDEAAVLLIRSPDGWRLRALLPAASPTQ